MSISTYANLQTAVENWLARTDQTSRVPEFISMAESEINRRLRIREMESRATATMTAGTRTLALPTSSDNFIKMLRLKYTSGSSDVILESLSPSQIMDEYPSTTNAPPQCYAILGDDIEFRPIPDSAYVVEALYLARLAALSASNVPVLFTQNPDIYLYGALAHAIPYINEPDVSMRMQMFRGLFEKALEEQKNHDMAGRYGATPLIVRTDTGNP